MRSYLGKNPITKNWAGGAAQVQASVAQKKKKKKKKKRKRKNN
jgi:hypothetical protein